MRGSQCKAGLLALAAVAVCYRWVIRGWQLGWGSTSAEAQGPLPGDELLGAADLVATRVIAIDAPAGPAATCVDQSRHPAGEAAELLHHFGMGERLLGTGEAGRVLAFHSHGQPDGP